VTVAYFFGPHCRLTGDWLPGGRFFVDHVYGSLILFCCCVVWNVSRLHAPLWRLVPYIDSCGKRVHVLLSI